MVRQSLAFRADKELADKKGMPGIFGNDPDRHPVLGVGAAVKVLHEEIAAAQVFGDALQQRVKAFRGNRLVHAAPLDLGVRNLIVHDEFVLGTAARACAGHGHQGSIGGQPGLASSYRCFYQSRDRQVEVSSWATCQRCERLRSRKTNHGWDSLRGKK